MDGQTAVLLIDIAVPGDGRIDKRLRSIFVEKDWKVDGDFGTSSSTDISGECAVWE